MSNYDALDIAASGINAQRLRMDTISSNIANISTTRDVDGNINPYTRRMVTFQTVLNGQIGGVDVAGIVTDNSAMKMVYDPSHPDSNMDGYVTYPNISIEEEMTDMISAKAAYQANITSIQTFKEMFNSSLNM
jgi:flagellar basal-body rod protein FlgC